MDSSTLFTQIQKKKSFLCIGLDTDLSLIPEHMQGMKNPLFEFNKSIIDATHDIAVSYKINTAFYESCGLTGWDALEKTIAYIREYYPDVFTIADAKRGDIGNTSRMYAQAFFQHMDFHAVTVAPYMGEDSIRPFLEFKDKWVIILALTSNKGAENFQFSMLKEENTPLYQKVIHETSRWGNADNIMYVTGATKADQLKSIRQQVPEHFFLVPGIGAQGGNLQEVCKNALNKRCGLIVNSSRAIIFADNSKNFAKNARVKALEVQVEMEDILRNNNLVL